MLDSQPGRYSHTFFHPRNLNSPPLILIPKLIHELPMELNNLAHPLRARGQKRGSEMQRAVLLAKPRAGDQTDSRRVEQFQAPEFVGEAVFLLGLVDGFVGEVDGGEEIH